MGGLCHPSPHNALILLSVPPWETVSLLYTEYLQLVTYWWSLYTKDLSITFDIYYSTVLHINYCSELIE